MSDIDPPVSWEEQRYLDVKHELELLKLSQLHWTSTKPSQPGWYWYDSGDVRDTATVVEVVHESEGLAARSYAVWLSLQYMEGQWAGPITPPEGD